MVACTLSLSTLAHATSPKPQQGGTSISSAAASATAISVSSTRSSASAKGGAGGQGGSVSYHEAKDRAQAPAVGAPGLTSFGGCKGSVSGGVGVAGFGIALGTTVPDEECQRLNNAAFLASHGHPDAAIALVCRNAGVKDAMAIVGKACPSAPPAPAAAPIATAAGQHPACSPTSWASREWRAANCQ